MNGDSSFIMGKDTNVAWEKYRSTAKKVVIQTNLKAPRSMAYWFYGFTNATFEGLEKIDTSSVTDMSHTFDFFCDGFIANANITFKSGVWSALDGETQMLGDFTVNKSSVFKLNYNVSINVGKFVLNSDTTIDGNLKVHAFSNGNSSVTVSNGGSIDSGVPLYPPFTSDTASVYFCDTTTPEFNLSGLEKWDVSKVKNMSYMFANNLYLQDLSPLQGWKTDSVTDMSSMFRCDVSIDDLSPLSSWNVGNVENMRYMFCKTAGSLELAKNGTVFSSLNGLNSWNVSNVTDMTGMFDSCNVNDYNAISNWKVNQSATMTGMFDNCISEKTPPSWYKK